MPGDMLEVRYLEMLPRFAFGPTLPRTGAIFTSEMAQRERVTIYRIDRATNLAAAEFAYDVAEKYTIPGRITDCSACNCVPALRGVRVPVRPHLGHRRCGTRRAWPDQQCSPRTAWRQYRQLAHRHRCHDVYPVQVPGALFSVGDPHISQGDGEISGTAIEASLDVLFQVRVRRISFSVAAAGNAALLDRARLRPGPECRHAQRQPGHGAVADRATAAQPR